MVVRREEEAAKKRNAQVQQGRGLCGGMEKQVSAASFGV